MNGNLKTLKARSLSAGFRSTARMLWLFAAAVASGWAAVAQAAAPGAPPWAAPAIAPGDKQMTLNWLPAGGAPDSYGVQYRASNSTESWTVITSLPLAPASYTVTGLANLKSYEFQVGATNGDGTTWNTKFHARPRGLQHPSGLHGGGQINAIVKAGNGVMLAGGDVSGFHRSLDGGETWFQSSRGVVTGGRAVGSLAYHSASGTLYGHCDGIFYRSLDNGASWTKRSSGLAIDANSSTYPRPVGRLVAVDPADANTVYVGTNSGLRKSTDGGATWSSTWTTTTLSGKVIRCVVLDNGYLYVAAGATGVFRVKASDGSATKFTGSGSSTKPEEILALGGNLYVAANTNGIRRLENPSAAAGGAAWTNLGITATGAWGAIDGYASGDAHVIVVGNCNPGSKVGSRYTTVMKCTNAQAPSGFNWVNISSAGTTTVKITLAAGNAETWWRVDSAKGVGWPASWSTEKRLDGNQFGIDQIVIDPANTNKIHAAGQMGIWRTLDGGATWEPAVIGLGAAVHNTVAVDPIRPGYVYVGDTDNGLWVSFDHAESVACSTKPNLGAKPTVRDVFVDGATGYAYVAIGDSPDGDVWFYNPTAKSWTNPKGSDATSLKGATGGNTPHGVAVGYVSGAKVILAAVEGSGIWRLAAGGNWALTSGGPGISNPPQKGQPFAWPSGTSLVYYYDGPTGVWRSTDGGQNWTKIWTKTIGGNEGTLAVPPTDTTQLFAAANTSVYRLDHASTGTPVINDLKVANPAACACGPDGTLWVTGSVTASGTADVLMRESTDGSTFTTYPDNYYQGAAGFGFQLAVEPGYQYTAASTMGTVVSELGRDETPTPTPSSLPSPSPTSHPSPTPHPVAPTAIWRFF